MDETEGVKVQRIHIHRVMRSMQITDDGRVVISFEAQGTHFDIEMDAEQAADLSEGLVRSLQALSSRRAALPG